MGTKRKRPGKHFQIHHSCRQAPKKNYRLENGKITMIKKEIKSIKLLPVTILLIIGFVASILIGCKSILLEKPGKNSLPPHELELLKNGYNAFAQTDYEKAAQIFNDLYKQNKNFKTRRFALYGLACTYLIKAENTLQYDEAIGLWNQWQQSVPETFSGEDPRMMWPYIQMTAPPCKKETEIMKLMNKNICLEKEILTLKHQIESLEAIDQKIEEKKKEISSPQ